jgi:hypothetical protein
MSNRSSLKVILYLTTFTVPSLLDGRCLLIEVSGIESMTSRLTNKILLGTLFTYCTSTEKNHFTLIQSTIMRVLIYYICHFWSCIDRNIEKYLIWIYWTSRVIVVIIVSSSTLQSWNHSNFPLVTISISPYILREPSDHYKGSLFFVLRPLLSTYLTLWLPNRSEFTNSGTDREHI